MEKEEKDFLVSFITDQRKQVRGSFLDTRRFIDTIVGGVFILSFIQSILGKPSLINKIVSGIFLLNFIISMIGQRFAEKQLRLSNNQTGFAKSLSNLLFRERADHF